MQSSSSEIGDIRQDIGELRGELIGIYQAIKSLDTKTENNQRVNINAHRRHDEQIAKLSADINGIISEARGKSHVMDWVKQLSTGGIAGASVAWLFDWFTKGGTPPHP